MGGMKQYKFHNTPGIFLKIKTGGEVEVVCECVCEVVYIGLSIHTEGVSSLSVFPRRHHLPFTKVISPLTDGNSKMGRRAAQLR